MKTRRRGGERFLLPYVLKNSIFREERKKKVLCVYVYMPMCALVYCVCMHVCVYSVSVSAWVQACMCVFMGLYTNVWMTPWMTAHQAPPPMGFSRQGSWSGLPCTFPRIRMSVCICICVCVCARACMCTYMCACVHTSLVSPDSFHYSEALQVCAHILSAMTNVFIGNQLPVPRAYFRPFGWASAFCINCVAPNFRLHFSGRETLLEKKKSSSQTRPSIACILTQWERTQGWVSDLLLYRSALRPSEQALGPCLLAFMKAVGRYAFSAQLGNARRISRTASSLQLGN